MKIAELVKKYTKTIFDYCEQMNPGELNNLLDRDYSKKTFNINYPFCIETNQINELKSQTQAKRYWIEEYIVNDKKFRVTSQWFRTNIQPFVNYLKNHGLANESEFDLEEEMPDDEPYETKQKQRFKGNHIGNAQNAVIRNILSNIGTENFTKAEWEKTKKEFENVCAYCGEPGILQRDHAIPINRDKLGEHKRGNIVPACKKCNSDKAYRDYKEFLKDNQATIEIIEKFMERHGYAPLERSEKKEDIKNILNEAHQKISELATKYIDEVNELINRDSDQGGESA